MARPTTFDDLPDYYRKGHVVATIPSDYITRYPSLGQHLLAALAEAERLGLTIDGDDVVIPLTDDELEKNLTRQQIVWDGNKATYEKALAGEPVEDWKWNSMARWCEAEGIEVPERVEAVAA